LKPKRKSRLFQKRLSSVKNLKKNKDNDSQRTNRAEGGYEDVYVGKEVMKIALNVHEEWYYGKHEDVNNAYYVPDKSKYKIVKGIIL